MALRTAVYMPDDVEAAWLAAKARGLTLTEVVRRGLGVPDPVSVAIADVIGQVSARMEDSVGEAVARGFARALRDLQSGSSV